MRHFIRNFFDDDIFMDYFDIFGNKNGHMPIRTDIRETDKEYIIEAEMPGFTKDQIDISLNNGYITIRADRKDETNEERNGYIRKERRHGQFQRSFRLSNIREDEITAKYENGILKVTLPKKQEGVNGMRRIDIQ
jgi:HSP20 family protein